MASLTISEGWLSDSSEVKLETGREPSLSSSVHEILSKSNEGSREVVFSKEREIMSLSDIETDLMESEDPPLGSVNHKIFWDRWIEKSEDSDSSPIAQSCHSEMSSLSKQEVPAATQLQKSWNTGKREGGFSELRSASSASMSSLEDGWKRYRNFESIYGPRPNPRKHRPIAETPPNALSLVTDTVVENKTRILAGISIPIGGVCLAGAVTAGAVGATVAAGVGLSASLVNLGASEAGRRMEKKMADSQARIETSNQELQRAALQNPSPLEMKRLMRERERLGRKYDNVIAKRAVCATVEKGASVASLVNLAASAAALPGALFSVADVAGSVGNALTIYDGGSTIVDMAASDS